MSDLKEKGSAKELAKMVADSARLFTDEGTPFDSVVVSEEGHPKVIVVTGENASGKSLFFQVAASISKTEFSAAPITVSIRERTGSGLSEMSGMRKVMMFGDESEQSTGATSARVVETGFRTAKSWAEEGKSPFLCLDEPEMGLSAGYSKAMGAMIAQEVANVGEGIFGVFVVTHDRGLVRGLIDELGEKPTFVNMNGRSDILDWLDNEETRSIDDLRNLCIKDRETWRTVCKMIDGYKKTKREEPPSEQETPKPGRRRSPRT